MAVAAPVVSVESAAGRVRLDLTLPTSNAKSFTVRRTEVVSGLVVAVRTLIAVPILGPAWQGYDYEAPIGVTVTYSVVVTFNDNTTDTSPESSTVTWTTDVSWLKDLQRPERSMVVTVTVSPELTYPVTQGVYAVLGRRTPVVVSDVRGSARGSITLATFTLDEHTNMLDVLASGFPVLFQWPPEFGRQLYVSVGQVGDTRPFRRGDKPARLVALELVEVDAPTIPITLALFTYQSVLDVYDTYQALLIGEATYYDLLTGPGIAPSATASADELPVPDVMRV